MAIGYGFKIIRFWFWSEVWFDCSNPRQIPGRMAGCPSPFGSDTFWQETRDNSMLMAREKIRNRIYRSF